MHTPLQRTFLLLRLLHQKHTGITVQELAAAADITERSVWRYLVSFREIGMTVERYAVGHQALYRVVRVNPELSKLVEFVPELPTSKHVQLPNPEIIKQASPIWIVEDLRSGEHFTYDTLPALLFHHPVCPRTKLYEHLAKSNAYVVPSGQYRIIKSTFYKQKNHAGYHPRTKLK